ncbi:MAG: hypothetical protein HQL47_11805 [Gammaproteobacteria bacterium]|nr:hypothetical protein [Gammaproteobacteria bacterium]
MPQPRVSWRLLDLLISAGADLNHLANMAGQNAFKRAELAKQTEISKRLSEAGAAEPAAEEGAKP